MQGPLVLLPAPAEPPGQLSLLATVHLQLTKLVAPARPATLLLLSDQRRDHPRRHSFGAIPVVRKMLALAVLSLLAMLGVALSHEVNSVSMTKGLLALEGYPLLINEIFLVAAAAAGIDSARVMGGIHGTELNGESCVAEEHAGIAGLSPVATLPGFVWN